MDLLITIAAAIGLAFMVFFLLACFTITICYFLDKKNWDEGYNEDV